MARAALELTVYQVNLDAQSPPSRGSFAFRIGNATVAADFAAETARIDLNAAPKELLSGLFAGLGAPRASADFYADRIIGWRGPPGPGMPDESSYYRAAGLVYSPRAAPFQHIAELGLVLGIPDSAGRACLAVPHGLFGSGRHQSDDRGAAGARRAARHGPAPPRRGA